MCFYYLINHAQMKDCCTTTYTHTLYISRITDTESIVLGDFPI